MKKLQFTTDIDASREKVWKALWEDQNYRKWTSVFSEGSYYESDLKEGSKILFLSADGGGMYSHIEKMNPPEFMSFKHIGEVIGGKEMPLDEKSKTWTGSMENYTLKESNGKTKLIVDLDITEDHAGYFQEAFPKALQAAKELAERI